MIQMYEFETPGRGPWDGEDDAPSPSSLPAVGWSVALPC